MTATAEKPVESTSERQDRLGRAAIAEQEHGWFENLTELDGEEEEGSVEGLTPEVSGEPKTLTPQKCVWKRDPDGDSYVWVIGCTNEFSIQPDAEDYGYCPRCGQDIKLVTAPLEDHEGRWPS